MSTPSGDLHVVDFKTNQIVSAVQPKDYWDDKRHWEIKNNIDTLEFRVFENTDHAATLVQQNLVLKEVRGGRIVPYVITETEKDSKDRSLMVYASGEWIQLAKAGIIEPQKIESKTLKQCMEIALKGTKWKIGKTEHDGAHSMVIEEFTDPLDLLKKIAASFELEIQYRAEVVGSKIVGRYVDMVQKRGRDTRKEVTFGKDLIGIKRIENSQSICTALLGFVKKENGEFITISSINKGVPYLVDDAAYQRWNENGKHKFAFYTPQTDDQNMSPERLLTLMKTEMGKLVNASVSYGVDAQNIARIPGLSHEEINEGDTIRIIDEGFTPKLYLEARAIAGDESFKDPTQDNYVFGDYREIVDQNDELRRLYQKILSSLYDKVPQELFDQLNNKVKEQNKDIIDAKDKADQAQKESQTAKDLAETTQKYMEQNMVDIIEQPTAPTENLRDGKTLWIDSSDPENKVQKLWKGGQWQRVTPDTGPLKQSIKEVKEDIETAKTELNQKVQGVEGKAQEIAGQIVDVQKQVNGKVDQTWINIQLKDKADKSGVFTKDEVNNGFIGKQIYETDKQGNVQKFKDINTSIGQTNEALTQKAEKSELTKMNDGLSQLEKKTNEVIQTAEGTKQTLTELKTQVDNTKIGGRNVVLGTSIPASVIGNNTANQTVNIYNFAGGDSSSILNKEICVSFDWKVEGTTTPSGTMYMQGSNPYPLIASKITFSPQNLNGKYLGVITINGSAFKAVNMRLDNFTTGAKITISNFQIEIGNTATEWQPAPEDQVTTTDFTNKTVEIETNIKGINVSVSNVQNEQGKLAERITKSEQTADGFKQSIESLIKKDNDISNKLNTVEQTVEGTKKTISDVQQTTTELKKTTTDIKEEAGKISIKLEQVEARTVGGENWLINTGPNERPQTIGMIGGALLNKVTSFVQPDEYVAIECQDHTDAFYQFHLDNTKIGDFEKGKDITISLDLQNDVHLDFILFQYINGLWSESVQKPVPPKDWRRESWTFKIDDRATGWGFRIRFARNEASKGKRFRFKKAKLEKGSVPTDFSKSTYEMKQSVDGVTTTITAIESKGIVGTNLVYNSNFLQRDTGLPLGWTYTNSSLTSYQEPWADESRAGVIRINRTTLAETDPNNIVSAYSSQFPVTLNTEYTFSVYMKIPNIATLKAKMAFIMEYYNASGTRVQYQDVTLTAGEIADLTANKWTRIVRTLKPTTTGIVKGVMRLALFHNGDIYYRMPQVELGDRVTGWNLSTSDFSTQHGLNELTVKTNTIKQTVDSNQQTINSLSQTQGKQGEIIQQNTSDITQLNNQIKSKVSETQMQNYVGGLGSTNLLLNTAFEKRDIDKNSGAITSRTPSFDKWIVPAGVTVDVARHHDGYNSAKIEKTGQTNPVYAGINQIIPVTSRSGVYVYSAWFYTDNKSLFEGQGGVIKMQLWNGNTALDFVQTELEPLLVNGSWVFASVNLGMPNKDVTHIRAEIWVRKNGRMWVSQPMLQQGSTPSTFMENPKDIGNYDALVGEIAKKVATSDFNNKVTQMETTINQQSNRIDLKAEATNVYTKTEADGTFGSKAIVESHSSQLSVMSNEISTRIKAGEIASAINQTAQAVLIQARKIYLDGYIEAKHLRAQELVGVTIKTAPQGSNNNHIRLNAQDMTLYGSGANRAYFGFMETTDGSIQPSLVLGSDNIKYRGAGSFYMYQAIPRINGFEQPSKAWAKFGISKGENAEGNNIWSSFILLQNDGGHMDIYADGKLRLKCLNNIEIESEGWTSGAGSFSVTTTEPHSFTNNWGQFSFRRKNSPNEIHIMNGANDHDLIMGRVTIRSSLVSGYNNGLQIKDSQGSGWRDIQLRTLYAEEDAIATQNMWAKAFKTTSARSMKENIKDIPFSALDKIMNLAIKQYNFKDDMYDLYQMRVNKPEEKTEPYTTKEIETYFGMIADDTDAIFTDKEKRAINLYNTVSIFIAAFQQQYHEFNEELTTVKGENKQLKEQVATIINDVSTLTELVQKLINEKTEQP
ncbi:phage tail spike protein [Bacillus cereus]|uniref:phage tail spike protein n=2 Tax=Bacillus cereus group TaxID=86661 RepID=UPI003D17E989